MTDNSISDLTRLVAANIRGLMAQHDVKQADMAESIGVSQSQFSKMLRGIKPIDLDQLDGMCTALDVKTSDIIKQVENTLAAYDVQPNARYIFVSEGVRRDKPYDTEGWGSSEPIVPVYRPRAGRGASE